VTRTGQVIRLPTAEVEFTDFGCTTRFDDGAHWESFPHDTHHRYYVASHQCGYGDDILSYCRFHDAAHIFVSWRILKKPSLLYALAHGDTVNSADGIPEEVLTQTFQKWVHANQEIIVADEDWHGLKCDFLALLA
jgi:hypothetical protein